MTSPPGLLVGGAERLLVRAVLLRRRRPRPARRPHGRRTGRAVPHRGQHGRRPGGPLCPPSLPALGGQPGRRRRPVRPVRVRHDAGGQCVSVPTQPRVPFGASVAAYPVDERDGVVWVWLGEPGAPASTGCRPALAGPDPAGPPSARRRRSRPGSCCCTRTSPTSRRSPSSPRRSRPPSSRALPAARRGRHRDHGRAPPPVPAGPMPAWQAAWSTAETGTSRRCRRGSSSPRALGRPLGRRRGGRAGGPAALHAPDHPGRRGRSRLHWRVSRDFALGDAAADTQMRELFADYYARVRTAMELTQAVIDTDGPGRR